jgi:hypothetical protein
VTRGLQRDPAIEGGVARAPLIPTATRCCADARTGFER